MPLFRSLCTMLMYSCPCNRGPCTETICQHGSQGLGSVIRAYTLSLGSEQSQALYCCSVKLFKPSTTKLIVS